jgi:multiple sugar transport system substrate-binding protein
MKKMKAPTIQLWSIVVVLLLVLVACAPAVTPEAAPAEEVEAPAEEAVEEPAEEASAEGEVAEGEELVPITILINDSPWFPGFEDLVNKYIEETGHQVNLSVTPFPAMLEKSRNAVQAGESEFDILNLNEQWYMQFYDGGLVTPIEEINPDFALDPEVIEYGYSTRWDPNLGYSGPDGVLYGLPINGNIQLYIYRKDLFDANGIEVPQTWADVAQVAETLQDPPNLYGFSIRSDGGNWEYQAYLHGYGASLVELDPETGQWEVGLAKPEALEATKTWLDLGRTYGPANYADMGQAENLALMASGKLAQVHMVGAAAPNFQDPDKSVVVDQLQAAVAPGATADSRATMSGIWVMGIPHNLPSERQQSALAFLKWALTKDAQLFYAQAGAIPVRQDVYEELADDPDLGWWMKAMGDSTPYIKAQPRLPETPQIIEVADRIMGQMLIDELTPEEALAQGSEEIYSILEKGGYDVKPLE